MHVLSTPPAFVLSQNQTLRIFKNVSLIQLLNHQVRLWIQHYPSSKRNPKAGCSIQSLINNSKRSNHPISLTFSEDRRFRTSRALIIYRTFQFSKSNQESWISPERYSHPKTSSPKSFKRSPESLESLSAPTHTIVHHSRTNPLPYSPLRAVINLSPPHFETTRSPAVRH